MFFYLPSTTDRKESLNQHRDSVSLNPINCQHEDSKQFSSSKQDLFPNHLDYKNEKGDIAVELMLNLFKHAVEVSNPNLIRKADYLLSKSEEPKEDIVWVGPTKKQFDNTKF